MRPRALGKITIIVLMIVCMLVAVIFALEADSEHLYKGLRGITYSVLALTFATLYRYLED
jgi:hypothetical protein